MKKLLSLILTLSMIFTLGGISLTANASTLQENPTALGDLDGDGRASAKDALLIMGAVVKLRTFNDNQKKCADINGDNKVTSSDSLLVLRYTVGLSTNGAQLLKDVRTGSDFSAYTGPYYCTVGRGASRYTMITLNADGTFTGVYSESILYDRDSGYDYTIYYNEFSGSFDGLTSTDTYEYGTRVKSFNLKYTPNTSEIKTGVRQKTYYPKISSISRRVRAKVICRTMRFTTVRTMPYSGEATDLKTNGTKQIRLVPSFYAIFSKTCQQYTCERCFLSYRRAGQAPLGTLSAQASA